MTYEEWSNYSDYRVNDYPGAGYILTLTLAWRLGMAKDFRDIRFYDGAPLNYWIESKTDGTSATVHIRLGTKRYITLYYGNGAAKSESSIDRTLYPGLRYEYYSGIAFNSLLGGGEDPNVSHSWGTAALSVTGKSFENRTDTTSIKWKGWVVPDGLGSTIFYTTSDDGQRLYVNGSLVIDNWADQGETERNYTYNLQTPTLIEYQYYENGGGATAKLGWDSVNSAKVYPIPSTKLRCKKYVATEPTATLLRSYSNPKMALGYAAFISTYDASGNVPKAMMSISTEKRLFNANYPTVNVDSYTGFSYAYAYRVNNPAAGATFLATIKWRTGMAQDFRDIRFTDGYQKLDYWIESKTNGVSAQVWIELGTTAPTKITMYYGNPFAVSESNGAKTFLLFEPFSQNTIGTVWEEFQPYSSYGWATTHTIENGGYHIVQSPANDREAAIRTVNAFQVATICQVNCEFTSFAGRSPPWAYVPSVGYNTNMSTFGYWGGVIGGFNPNSPSDNLQLVWNDNSATNNVKIYRISGSNKTLVHTTSTNVGTTKKPSFGMRTASSETINLYYKNFFARKYVAIEPTLTDIGSVNFFRFSSIRNIPLYSGYIHLDREADMFCLPQILAAYAGGFYRQSDSSLPISEILTAKSLLLPRESRLEVPQINEDVQLGVSTSSEVALIQSQSERVLAGLRESGMDVLKVRSLTEMILTSLREGSASIPAVQVSAGFGLEASVSVRLPEIQSSRASMSFTRESVSNIPELLLEVARQITFSRESGVFIPAVNELLTPVFSFDREAGVSIPAPFMELVFTLAQTTPTAPFFISITKTGYHALIMDGEILFEITQMDSDTFTGTLYDSDPSTGVRRLLTLTGKTVKAVLKGGIHTTTITKDCTVTGQGTVSFDLASADTAVPGMYTIKFVVTGASGFRKELPERLDEVQTVRINDKNYGS